jgi:hypothetical protein
MPRNNRLSPSGLVFFDGGKILYYRLEGTRIVEEFHIISHWHGVKNAVRGWKRGSKSQVAHEFMGLKWKGRTPEEKAKNLASALGAKYYKSRSGMDSALARVGYRDES